MERIIIKFLNHVDTFEHSFDKFLTVTLSQVTSFFLNVLVLHSNAFSE